MKSKLNVFLTALMTVTLVGAYTTNKAFADETVKEKVSEAGHDTKRAMKKAGRKVKDETCEMINGKMECVGKKIKNTGKNIGDKAEDIAD